MGIDLSRFRRKKDNTASSGGFWTPKTGKNVFRIFPFEHTITNDDFTLGRYTVEDDDKKVGMKSTEIDCEVSMHFINKQPKNCTMTDCKLCKDASEAGDRMLGRRKRYYVNVMVTMEGGKQLASPRQDVGAFPQSVYGEFLSYLTDDDYGPSILGEKGRDVVIEYDKQAQGSDMYSLKLRDKEKCETVKLTSEVQDLYANPDFLPTGFSFTSGKDAPPEKEEEEPHPVNSKRQFDDAKLGTIKGTVTGIEKDKKGALYILTDADGTEYETRADELTDIPATTGRVRR